MVENLGDELFVPPPQEVSKPRIPARKTELVRVTRLNMFLLMIVGFVARGSRRFIDKERHGVNGETQLLMTKGVATNLGAGRRLAEG
jgi:hypothetical protein